MCLSYKLFFKIFDKAATICPPPHLLGLMILNLWKSLRIIENKKKHFYPELPVYFSIKVEYAWCMCLWTNIYVYMYMQSKWFEYYLLPPYQNKFSFRLSVLIFFPGWAPIAPRKTCYFENDHHRFLIFSDYFFRFFRLFYLSFRPLTCP